MTAQGFVVFKDILKKIRSSEISFFLALQKKNYGKKSSMPFFSFQFFYVASSSPPLNWLLSRPRVLASLFN